jgi:hypothetical protein
VTERCVPQSQHTENDEPNCKLETDPKALPEGGTPLRLVIVVK